MRKQDPRSVGQTKRTRFDASKSSAIDDPEAGAREYVEWRAKWEPGIEGVAPALGYRREERDRAGYGGASRAAGG
jgi:hypothetical protein